MSGQTTNEPLVAKERPAGEHLTSDLLLRFLVFKLDNELYGLGSGEVTEVMKLPTITPIPFMRPEVLGLTNLRGYPLVICDLRKSFGVSQAAEPGFVVVAEIDGQKIGLAVDFIEDVVSVAEADVKLDTSVSHECQARHVHAILRCEEKLIYLVNLKSWFTAQRFARG